MCATSRPRRRLEADPRAPTRGNARMAGTPRSRAHIPEGHAQMFSQRAVADCVVARPESWWRAGSDAGRPRARHRSAVRMRRSRHRRLVPRCRLVRQPERPERRRPELCRSVPGASRRRPAPGRRPQSGCSGAGSSGCPVRGLHRLAPGGTRVREASRVATRVHAIALIDSIRRSRRGLHEVHAMLPIYCRRSMR